MDDYPEVVAKLVQDYLERLKCQLSSIPSQDREEFLQEIGSHVYEAYHCESGEDEVARILAVLRKLGEPSEVVAERLPEAMVSVGKNRSLPLYVVGGVLIALFGLPLGFGGVAVLVGMLAALAGVVLVYFATAASMVLVGLIGMSIGLLRIFEPELWDKLVFRGFIHIEGRVAEFLDLLSPSGQGVLFLLFAGIFAASGLAMLWLGKYLLRGLRFLVNLLFDWVRRLARRVGGLYRREQRTVPFGRASLDRS